MTSSGEKNEEGGIERSRGTGCSDGVVATGRAFLSMVGRRG